METATQQYKLVSHSHHDWEKAVIAEHENTRPFAPENGSELKFRAGDKVIFTNDFGVSFKMTVTGLYKPDPVNSLYATGYRYLVDSDSPWFPCRESSLSADSA